MGAFLVLSFMFAGQLGLNVAIPYATMEKCNAIVPQVLEKSNSDQLFGPGSQASDAKCFTKQEFFKMTGQRES